MNRQVILDKVVVGHSPRTPSIGPVSLTLEPNTVVALVGPNGSGKSTLLKCLVGEAYHLAGEISLFGLTPVQALHSGKISYVPQDPLFADHLSVFDLVALGLFREIGLFGSCDSSQTEKIHNMLRLFGLENLGDRRASELSIGEKQRALLARALIQQPQLLLLDEPTNHLDPSGQKRFWTLITEQIRERQITAWIATHDYSRAEQFSDVTVALTAGSLCAIAPSSVFWKSNTARQVFGDYT